MTQKNANMSQFPADIYSMHSKFGVNPIIRSLDKEKLQKFLEFRLNFLQEELDEAKTAIELSDEEWAKHSSESKPAAIVDAMIDLIVVAVGTLDAFDVDVDVAWDKVHSKNMLKTPGIKPERPNPLGLPDLIKPAGWTAPNHEGNVGFLPKAFN